MFNNNNENNVTVRKYMHETKQVIYVIIEMSAKIAKRGGIAKQ